MAGLVAASGTKPLAHGAISRLRARAARIHDLWFELKTAVSCASQERQVQDLRTFAAPRMNWQSADKVAVALQGNSSERCSGFIVCHHTVPVSTMEPGRKTKLSELALVCANCHRMIRLKRPWLEVEELKMLLKS